MTEQITDMKTSKQGIMYFVDPKTGRTCVNMRSLINFLAPEQFHNRINIMLSNSWGMFDLCGRVKDFEDEGVKFKFYCRNVVKNIRATKWGDIDGAVRFVKTIHMYLRPDVTVQSAAVMIQDLKPELKSSRIGAVNLPSSREAIAEIKSKPTEIVETTLRMRIDCLNYELSQAKITIAALRNRDAVIDQSTVDELAEAKSKLALSEHKVQELELQVAKLTDTALTSRYGSVFFQREAFLEACDEVGINREYAEKHMVSEASTLLSESILATAQNHPHNSGYRKTGEECLNSWGSRRLKELDLTKFAVKVYTDLQKKKLLNF